MGRRAPGAQDVEAVSMSRNEFPDSTLVEHLWSKEIESWAMQRLPWLPDERRVLSKREIMVNRMRAYQQRLRDAMRILAGEDVHEDCW